MMIACLAVAACSPGADAPKIPPPPIAVDAPAPDFRLRDLQGKEIRLADLRGRPVLLVFGATWCRYCIEEIPRIRDIHARGRAVNLEVLNIFVNDSENKVGEFAARHALPFTVLTDPDGKVAQLYQVRGVPMLVLLDRQGNILCIQCRNLENLLKRL
ncbi:MAG: TlpA family protein disulfide reductase [Syntrophaceae bacterium]|nr:TlpA family protein disulfide reductase [Syntrophaceae bacterium]